MNFQSTRSRTLKALYKDTKKTQVTCAKAIYILSVY